MKPAALTLILMIFIQLNLYGQIEDCKSLIVAEYQKGENGVGNFTWLTTYNFKNGKYISKDTILAAPTSKKGEYGSYVRFDLGKNLIHLNRYLISGIGNIIDLKEEKIILDESDELIKTTDKSILFHRSNLFSGTGYLTFDLKTHEYKFINKDSKPSRNHLYSPNRNYLIEIEKSKIPYQIILSNKKGKTIFEAECGFGTSMSIYSSSFPNVPIFWINDNNFICAEYKGNEVKVIKINTAELKQEHICKIDSIPEAVSNAYFYFDLENNLIFNCAKGDYKIDLKNKSTEQINFYERGNNFKVEIEQSEIGRKILFEEELIGNPWCNGYNAQTTKELIAIEYGEPKSNLGNPKGIKIWSSETKKWLTIEIPWVCGIIGWTEN